ncbi:MAG: DUF86 domain-containing protein [Bacteroidales bacterium]|nr:DUF86 domain-containing protein [Bacteroidales bacterium]
MWNRPAEILLEDMLEAIGNIELFIRDMSYDDYQSDRKTRAAVERYLEVLGEAANKFTESFYNDHPHIGWHRIISLRNRIIHSYFDVSSAIVWNIITQFIPVLKSDLQSILKKLENE